MEQQNGPQSLPLWRCIGCGSMGNFEACVGTCAFTRVVVVSAERHAELLDYFLTLDERLATLRVMAREAVETCAAVEGFAAGYEHLRSEAKKLLQSTPGALDPPLRAAQDERNEIWLCASCGQVEALHECLGICVRRQGEFVRAEDHDALDARVQAARGEARRLASLARQLGWASPRPGQWEQMRVALWQTAKAALRGF